jgi:hypothetical protein
MIKIGHGASFYSMMGGNKYRLLPPPSGATRLYARTSSQVASAISTVGSKQVEPRPPPVHNAARPVNVPKQGPRHSRRVATPSNPVWKIAPAL